MNGSPPPTLADRYLPAYDVRSGHEIEVGASADETYRAARALDLSRSIPVAVLVGIRTLPHLVTGKMRPTRSLSLQTFLDAGFTILEESAPNGLALGTVGKFWRPDSGLIRVSSDEFQSFDEPGFAKGLMTLTVGPRDPTSSILATETRVACTDASSRRKFGLYWRAIGPFSGLIRGVMLRQVKRVAESG